MFPGQPILFDLNTSWKVYRLFECIQVFCLVRREDASQSIPPAYKPFLLPKTGPHFTNSLMYCKPIGPSTRFLLIGRLSSAQRPSTKFKKLLWGQLGLYSKPLESRRPKV